MWVLLFFQAFRVSLLEGIKTKNNQFVVSQQFCISHVFGLLMVVVVEQSAALVMGNITSAGN